MLSFFQFKNQMPHVYEDRSIDNAHLCSSEHIEIKRYVDGVPVSSETVWLDQSTFPIGRSQTNILPEKIGRVFYQGTYWKALCCGSQEILKDQRVLVLHRQGLTLWVIPVKVSDSPVSGR